MARAELDERGSERIQKLIELEQPADIRLGQEEE